LIDQGAICYLINKKYNKKIKKLLTREFNMLSRSPLCYSQTVCFGNQKQLPQRGWNHLGSPTISRWSVWLSGI